MKAMLREAASVVVTAAAIVGALLVLGMGLGVLRVGYCMVAGC